MTLTYTELEHAPSNHHIIGLLLVVDRRGRHNRTICSAHGECLASRSRKKYVFRRFRLYDRTYRPPRCLNLRICADRQTDTTPCACAWGKNMLFPIVTGRSRQLDTEPRWRLAIAATYTVTHTALHPKVDLCHRGNPACGHWHHYQIHNRYCF